MLDEPFYRMPDEVVVPLEELRSVVIALERLRRRLYERKADDDATLAEELIGRIVRWIWSLLGDLDAEEDQ